jgi:thiol-disulfide isomerase/thioredoxin
MSGLRSAFIVLTALLAIGLTGAAFFNAFSTDEKAPDEIACQPLPSNPKRHFLPVGSNAANFKLTSANGNMIELKKMLKEKPVLVEFFATWCPHCQHSAPALNELHKLYGNKVQLLAVNAGDRPNTPSTSDEYKSHHHIQYPVLNLPSADTQDHYCVEGFPTFVLVDKHSKVLWAKSGGLKGSLLHDLLGELNKIGIDTADFKEPPAPTAAAHQPAAHP